MITRVRIGEYNHAWCRMTYYETPLYARHAVTWGVCTDGAVRTEQLPPSHIIG